MRRISQSFMSTIAGDKIQLDPGIWTRTSRIQLLYGVWVNITYIAIGLGFGFALVQDSQLATPGSEIPITRIDASWSASVLLLFCPIGCIISGFVTDRCGCRFMIVFSQVPMLIGWLYTSLAKTLKQLIIARAITGVGCGMAMIPTRIYCTEISLPNIRGVLGSFPLLALSIGISAQAAANLFFLWKFLCYVCCIFTFASFCSFIFLPETPYFTLKTKSAEDARASLVKFRGPNYNIDREMEQLRDFRDDNHIRKLSFMENMGALCSVASCKPFFLMVTYLFIGQLAGNSCIMFWSTELLTEAKSSVDVQTGYILLALSRIFMVIITAILLYRVGSRRFLALISAIGVILTCFTLGMFLIDRDEPSVIPIICFILYNVFASLGYYILPNLMIFELLPLQVRGILGGAFVSIHCLMMFASTKVGPFMVDFLGVEHTFLTFGGFSLAGVVFLYFYLPETRDLTLPEIEEFYKEIRPTLVSQRRILSLSLLAMHSAPKSSSTKLNDEGRNLMTSKNYVLAKLEAQRQLLMHKKRQQKSRTEQESNKSTKVSKSSGSLRSSDSVKSTDSRRSIVIFEDQDKDVDSVKSSKLMDSKKSPEDGKSKDLKERSKDGEETPKASTSKKNT